MTSLLHRFASVGLAATGEFGSHHDAFFRFEVVAKLADVPFVGDVELRCF